MFLIANINDNNDFYAVKAMIDSLSLWEKVGKFEAIGLTKKENGIDKDYNKETELSYSEHILLVCHAKNKGYQIVETISCIEALEVVAEFADYIRLESKDIANIPLLRAVANYNKPVILSTGLSLDIIDDIKNAVSILPEETQVIVLTEILPVVPCKDASIRSVLDILNKSLNKERFTIGYLATQESYGLACASIAYGAEAIMMPISLERKYGYIGLMDCYSYLSLLFNAYDIHNAVYGDYITNLNVCKIRVKEKVSCVYNKDLLKGKILTRNDIRMISNGEGLSYYDVENKLIGLSLIKSVKENESIRIPHLTKG